MIEKNQQVYRIPSLQLFNHSQGVLPADEDGTETLRQIIAAAAYDTSSSSTDTSSSQESSSQPSARLKLDLIDSSLELKHVMALCPALHYGSPIETLRLKNIFARVNDEGHAQCWGWLAFGIFYPRSKRLASNNRLRHVTLSDNLLDSYDAGVFVRTLRDPAGELVYQGNQSQQCVFALKGKLLISRIKKGTKFYATPKISPEVLSRLGYERELEVLCQQQGWTCVVLPGLDFGWVSDDQVTDIEEEVIDDSNLRVEFTFNSLDSFRMIEPISVFEKLIRHVGHHLSYLDVSHSPLSFCETLVGTILKHCVNLEHLVLVKIYIGNQHASKLLEALRGDLGDCLKPLNLSKNDLSDDVCQKFAAFLADPKRTPALQEFRLKYLLDKDAFAAYQNMLLANKTLRFVELMEPYLYRLDHRVYRTAQSLFKRIKEENQGELLPSPLPLRQKLAFLSAISPRVGAGDTARGALDLLMVPSIFKFATEDLRRRIISHTLWY